MQAKEKYGCVKEADEYMEIKWFEKINILEYNAYMNMYSKNIVIKIITMILQDEEKKWIKK